MSRKILNYVGMICCSICAICLIIRTLNFAVDFLAFHKNIEESVVLTSNLCNVILVESIRLRRYRKNTSQEKFQRDSAAQKAVCYLIVTMFCAILIVGGMEFAGFDKKILNLNLIRVLSLIILAAIIALYEIYFYIMRKEKRE